MTVRKPRAWIEIGGAKIASKQVSVTRYARRDSDTFAALLSISETAKYGYDLAAWTDFEPEDVSVWMASAADGSDARLMVKGQVDEPHVSLTNMTVSISGRDKSSKLANSTDAVIDAVAKSVVARDAPTPTDSVTVVTTAVLDQRSAVQVQIREAAATIMGKLMSLPTMDIGASATAALSGKTKLCLLVLEAKKGKALNLDDGSSMTAQGCAIYSDSSDKGGLRAGKGAQATASLICSAGGVDNKGASLLPVPTTDCPVVDDPLASMSRPSIGICRALDLKITFSTTLWPGTYCGGVTISGTAAVTLMPGVYVMHDGPLIVANSASLTGRNTGIFFTGSKGGMRLDPDTTINLTAPSDGPMAGLLFFEDRSISPLELPVPPPPGPKGSPPPPPYGSQPMRQYQITSNNAPNLLGTIYLPAGRLIIDASTAVAERSAYTVVIARQLELNSGPNLFLNSDYDATDIPVPSGVGNKTAQIKIVQ